MGAMLSGLCKHSVCAESYGPRKHASLAATPSWCKGCGVRTCFRGRYAVASTTRLHGPESMATQIPPLPPPIVSDEGPLQRVHFRLWQIVMTGVTILLTAWFFTLGVL